MSIKSPVLIASATRWEASPLARALGLPPSGEGRWEGLAQGRRIVLLKTGIGALKTREILERDCVAGDYGLVLSAGLCGGMQPDVRFGDIVADVQDVEIDAAAALKESAAAMRLPFHFGKILHTNVILRPALKRRLGAENRAIACDMETAAVRRWAGGKTPVIGLRVVLDELDDTVPSDSPESDDAASLARFALSHVACLPSMIKTGYRASRAMRKLTRFIRAYLEKI